jgi:hypothetical protein
MCTTCKIMNLTGKVKEWDGTLLDGGLAQKMKFTHTDGTIVGPFWTGTDGSYSVALPLQGTWVVRVNTCLATPSSISVEVAFGWCTRHFKRNCDESGNPVPQQLDQPHAVMDGIVVGPLGEAVHAPQEVTLLQGGQTAHRVWTEPDGSFELRVNRGVEYGVLINRAATTPGTVQANQNQHHLEVQFETSVVEMVRVTLDPLLTLAEGEA